LGYPGIQGLGWRGHACVKNLPQVGGEVYAQFGGDSDLKMLIEKCLVFDLMSFRAQY